MNKRLFLHLEDNRVAQKLLANTFKEIADFISIQTIKEAEKAIQDHPDIDCFFIDLNLENENGLDFLKKIRTIRRYDISPAFLLTSTLTSNLAYKAMRAGANESISKLVSPSDLREIIQKHLEHRYVKLVSQEFYEVECLSWAHDNHFYQYSPDIEKTVSGRSPEEVHALMDTEIETWIQSRKNVIFDTNSAGVRVHRFDLKNTPI